MSYKLAVISRFIEILDSPLFKKSFPVGRKKSAVRRRERLFFYEGKAYRNIEDNFADLKQTTRVKTKVSSSCFSLITRILMH